MYEVRDRVLVQIGPHVFPGTVITRTYERNPDYQVELDCGVYITRGVVIVRKLEEKAA